MTKEERALRVCCLLDQHYPFDDKCYLDYDKPYELLISTILAAQCTDDRVNLVTKHLFKKYPTLESFAEADQAELEQAIHSTGFYRNKAKNIILSARRLIEYYQGEMPSKVEELITLPGVGRKTANVVRSHIFHLPSVVVDTHVKRISGKLGLTESQDPVKIEFELMALLPEEHWIRYNTQVIAHGRQICKAGRPKCAICPLSEACKAVEAETTRSKAF